MERIDQPTETPRPDERKKNSSSRYFFGLVLVFVGAYWFLNRAGWIDFPHWLFQWPVILIALGVFNLVTNKFRSVGGYILLLLGAYFYADRNFDVPYDLGYYFWPGVLIIVGLVILLRPSRSKRFDRWRKENNNARTTMLDSKDAVDDSNFMEEVILLGGVKKEFTSNAFQGGKLTCVMGGAEIFMGDCVLEGDAAISINCVMGGASITIPKEWRIRVTANSVLGGIDDDRRLLPELPANAPVLTITGSVVLGGLEIKSV